MKIFFKKSWPLLIIVLLGLVPLFWFRKGYLIAGGDNSIYLDPAINLYNYYYVWNVKFDAGVPSLERPKIFPFSPFWLVGEKMGLSLEIIQRLWIVLHFILPGLFLYLLIKSFYKSSDNKDGGSAAGLIGAVSYMFNFLVIVDAIQPVLRPVIAFLPLMLFFWMKALSEKNFSLKYPSIIALTSLLYASSNLNVASVSPIYIVLMIYLVYFLITKGRLKHVLLMSVSTMFLFLLTNLWWITNFYYSTIKASEGIISVVRGHNYLQSTLISEAFRTMGFWGFLQLLNNKTLVPFALSYYRFPLIIITFLIPILGFSSLLFSGQRKYKLFFAVLALFGIFLSKGTNLPFGFFYQFLYDKFPGFAVFREPFAKFTLISVFSFSVLIGLFAEDVFLHLSKTGRKILPVLAIGAIGILILLCWYPLLKGKNIQDESWYQDPHRSLYVKIPDYWYQAKDWFNKNNSSSKIMLFPKTHYGQVYQWQSGITSGDPIALYLLPNPLIRHPDVFVNEENRLAKIVYQLPVLAEKADFWPYLNLFAVDFVLQQNDVFAENKDGYFDPSVMSGILQNQKNLKKVASLGLLDIYKMTPEGSVLQVYKPNRIIYVDGKLESFNDIFSFYQYRRGDGFLFLDEENVLKKMPPAYGKNEKIFINLKEKLRPGKVDDSFVFDANVLKKGDYSLLINNFFFKTEFSKLTSYYYLSFNDINLVIPLDSMPSWRKIRLGNLEKGNYIVRTNLPVEYLDQNLTSPLWLVEENSLFNEDSSASPDYLLSYKKINPTKYQVKIENLENPFLLVLSESFNKRWKIYYNGKKIEADHFLINGYANGWTILPEAFEVKSNLVLELRYEPQKYADIGLTISLSTVFLILSFLILKKRKRHE